MKKILFIQEIPEIRSIKTALALKEQGVIVDCLTTLGLSFDRNDLKGLKPFNNERVVANKFDIKDLCKEYDLIHFHNAPDKIGLIGLASGKPLVWDCHDTVSLLDIKDPRGNDSIIEWFLYQQSKGNIFASKGFQDYCAQKYGQLQKPSIIIENYPAKWMIPIKLKPKLSDKDHKIHIVYAGSISNEPNNHRNFYQIFQEYLKLSEDIRLHIYPASSPRINGDRVEYEQFETLKHQNLIIHQPVSVLDLIEEVSQYDWGLLPFDKKHQFTQYFTPNKLYEYAAAQLKILTQSYQIVNQISRNWENILEYEEIDQELLKKMLNFNVNSFPIIPTFESQSHLLNSFYQSL